MRAQLAGAEARAAEAPERSRYVALTHDFARAMLEAHEAWLDQVEDVLRRDAQTG